MQNCYPFFYVILLSFTNKSIENSKIWSEWPFIVDGCTKFHEINDIFFKIPISNVVSLLKQHTAPNTALAQISNTATLYVTYCTHSFNYYTIKVRKPDIIKALLHLTQHSSFNHCISIALHQGAPKTSICTSHTAGALNGQLIALHTLPGNTATLEMETPQGTPPMVQQHLVFHQHWDACSYSTPNTTVTKEIQKYFIQV